MGEGRGGGGGEGIIGVSETGRGGVGVWHSVIQAVAGVPGGFLDSVPFIFGKTEGWEGPGLVNGRY